MSQYWVGTAAVIAGLEAMMVASVVDLTGVLMWAVVLGVALLAGTLWYVSPLPNHNGSTMVDRGTYWGIRKNER